MAEKWMQHNEVSNVQSAIESQTIQTAIEGYNSNLTPAQLQSFLSSAPIPRFYYEMDPTWAVANGNNQFMNWAVNANSYDPYGIVVGGGVIVNTFICPLDGFYLFTVGWSMNCSVGATGYMNTYFYDPTVGLTPSYGQTLEVPTTGANQAYQGTITYIVPIRAGKRFAVNVGNVSGGTLTVNVNRGSFFSGVWIAPYINYQSGGQ